MKNILKTVIGVLFLIVSTLAQAEKISYIPENPKRALIIIHGYGGDGHRLNWMTESLKGIYPDLALYYPTGPDKAPTGGYQWFVLPSLGEKMADKSLYDVMMKDAIRNTEKLNDLVDEIHQKQNIEYSNIYVSGFSQGGLMALLVTLTNHNHLTKAVSFSGVPLLFTPDFSERNIKTKPNILLIQGNQDQVIPSNSLDMTTDTLNQLQIEPTVKEIPNMGHQINSEALKYMIEFIQ